MKLFEIANEYQSVLSEIYDPETGEFNAIAFEKLDNVIDDVKNKSIAVASYIQNLSAEKEAIANAKKAMAEREARLESRASFLTAYLQSNMERCGINEISCAYFAIKLKKCPVSVDIVNESLLPPEYKKTKEVISIDKMKIKEELQAGVIIPGVGLKQNLRLEIR